MKFTLDWLKEHLDTAATLDEITFALTDLGLEVESVTNPAARLAAFTVGEVIEAVQHPDADKLRVCRVATAGGEKQIVCGAPNARTGIKVVVAAPGDWIPGIDTTIKIGRIRGVESHGMMLSEREMELSDAHDGIVELPADAPVGARYIDVVGFDPVIDVAVTPNRPDALGVAGIARDLAARGLGRVVTPEIEPVEGAEPCPVGVYLAPDVAGEACPLFAGRLIRGVSNGPSPQWLQDRLRAIGLRPISALVDITNFVTYDRNRPLHVFDADKLHGAITVRLARPGERLTALDGKTYAFDGSETLVCDEQGAEAIGGVIGGMRTGCTPQTVNVFVESAWFDPKRTARTGRRLRINSDARYRFERGVDPAFTPVGIELATRMILDLCGGEASDVTVAGDVPQTARGYPLDPTHVDRLVGMEIPRAEQVRILAALGFAPAGRGDLLEVAVPSWRPDIQGSADLVEEIARIASLSRLEGRPLRRPAGIARPILTPMQRREGQARRRIAALGYNECVTYSFIDHVAAATFGGGREATRLENPISSEMSHLRPDLLPGPAAGRRPQSGPRLPRPRALRGRPGLCRRRAGRAGAPRVRGPHRRDRATGRSRQPPAGRFPRCPRRCRGGARGDRRAGQARDPARRAGMVPSRPFGCDHSGPEDRSRSLRRTSSPRSCAPRCARPGCGLHHPARGTALSQVTGGHPPAARRLGSSRRSSGTSPSCSTRPSKPARS